MELRAEAEIGGEIAQRAIALREIAPRLAERVAGARESVVDLAERIAGAAIDRIARGDVVGIVVAARRIEAAVEISGRLVPGSERPAGDVVFRARKQRA
jgi:hypothetical protein